jgi:hypothetical protein
MNMAAKIADGMVFWVDKLEDETTTIGQKR